MFSKFEAFMNRVFMPLAHKVDNQRHLGSIKAGMVAMTPFTILGSIFAILPALPNMLGENNPISKFILNNSAILDLPVSLSIGLIGLYACCVLLLIWGTTINYIYQVVLHYQLFLFYS